jgi:hypothetical protein
VTIKDIARHPNTPAAALDIVACALSVNELDALQGHPNLSALAREIIAYRQHHAPASPAALELMISHLTMDVYNRLIYAPDTPASVLRLLFNRMQKDRSALIFIAQHPNTPPDVLAQLAGHANPKIQEALARNPNFQRPSPDET